MGNTIRYSYDTKGNLISKIDGNGQVISFTYDSLNRLTSKTYPDGGFESFTYDSNGRIISASNQYISYALSYDAAGRITQSTDSRGYTVRYRYDIAGNRTGLTYPDGGSATYSYDNANRLSSMTDWAGRSTTFGYDSLGRRIALNMPNGTKTTYSYDQASRLIDLTHKAGGSILDSFSYGYNPVGNRLSVTRPEEKINYTYDILDRLIEATPTKLKGKDKEQENKAEVFSYDAVSNRMTGPESKGTYTYNPGNQLISDRRNQYGYDRNGNLTRKTEIDDDGEEETWAYSYDFENRLIKVVKQEEDEIGTITFKYDPFGRRIEKKVSESSSPLVGEGKGEGEAKTHAYVYDNEDIITEYLTKAEGAKSKTETTRHLHGPGIDGPSAVEQKGEIYYYHADSLGSIMAITDGRQKTVQSYDYTSFGQLKHQGDKVKQPYAFTAREWDAEIGLYYYRARYYDSGLGRFLSKDPKGFKINLYEYVRNNPLRFIDPLGLEAGEVCSNITIKRKNIHLTGEDKYGHWWVEIGSESYGWWPKYPVGLWDTLTGVEGELNGQTSFGGTPTRDPHHGDSSEETFHPRISSSEKCGCMTCEEAENCTREFSRSYTGGWSWPWGQNCHSFQNSMMGKCCLER